MYTYFPPFFFYFFGAINISILFLQDFFSLFQSTMQLLMLSDHVATEYQWRVLYELRRVSADPTYTRSNMNVKVIYATRWSLKPRGKKTWEREVQPPETLSLTNWSKHQTQHIFYKFSKNESNEKKLIEFLVLKSLIISAFFKVPETSSRGNSKMLLQKHLYISKTLK